MRLTTFILMISLLQVNASTFGQRFTMQKKNASLNEVFTEIRKQTGYFVIYADDKIDASAKLDINFKQTDLKDVLSFIGKSQELQYTIDDKNISFKPKDPTFLDRVVATLTGVDVTGRVVDSENRPLPGASVKIKKTGKAVSTDSKGNFYLKNVEEGAVLVVSYTGYVSREVKADKDMGNIALEMSLSKLDEVQVIAYGTTTQRLSTGNITTIKADVIEKQPVSNPLLALQGRVPGLFIEQATGFAGTGVKVRIQGQNSIRSGNDPFYVIDGVPFPSQLAPGVTNLTPNIQGTSGNLSVYGNPLNFINPADIESIDVLKGADATAIYGSRAANGAILITTKKGKPGEVKIDVNLQTGVGQVPRKIKMLNTTQYLEVRREALKNSGFSVPGSTDYDLNGVWDTTRNIDWQKKLLGRNALYQDFQSSISGGSNTTTYLIGAGYHRETNVFPGEFADGRSSLHLNINSSSSNQKFKIQVTGSYLNDNNKLPTIDLTGAIALAPNAPEPYNPDGSLNWQPNGSGTTTFSKNPLAAFKNSYKNKTTTLTNNTLLIYQLLKGLDLKSSFGFTRLNSDQSVLYPTTASKPEDLIFSRGTSLFSKHNSDSWLVEPQLTFNGRISGGKIDLLVGATLQQSKENSLGVVGSNYTNDLLLNDLKSAPNVLIAQSINSAYKYNALYGRINYNWRDKYILNLTARRDGSSNFGPESQFHNFGAIGLAWIFSQNRFIKTNIPFLSQGKLRASYGTTGSDQIGSYQFLDLYESVSVGIPYQGGLGLSSNRLNNPNLQWEETRKFEIGLDLGLFNDRIIINANYNLNRSSNQLLNLSLPVITGAYSVASNLPAVVQNIGGEFLVRTTNITQKEFSWTSSFNLTISRNKLVSLRGHELEANSTYYLGQPLSVQRVYRFSGVNEDTGLYQFLNSKGEITSDPSSLTDLTFVNIDPKFYGGLQNRFSYKAFSIDVLFQFVKQIGYDWTQLGTVGSTPGRFNQGGPNLPISLLDRWQKPGDITNHQLFTSRTGNAGVPFFNASSSDYMYTDASYIRLKNISILWASPDRWKKALHVKNLGFFIQAQNLLTITKYEGLDPETKGFGLPPLRTMTMGIRITL